MDTPNDFLIYNARIMIPGKILSPGVIRVVDGKITEIHDGNYTEGANQYSKTTAFDAQMQWIVPGFIDMHVHGGNGADVMDGTPNSIDKIARFHTCHGTTSWLPTTLTAPVEDILKSLRAIETIRASQHQGATILGVHLEGPFIASERKGAQNPEYIQLPSIKSMARLTDEIPGLIRKVTIASEIEGGVQVISWLKKKGIISSIGHTNGNFEETEAGIRAGATHATHLFNAMNVLHHREPGAVGACLTNPNVLCELIVDYRHLHPSVIKLVIKLKGTKKVALITDATSPTGRPDGDYQLGGLPVNVKGGIALLSKEHKLAGSTLTMDLAVRNLVNKVGISLIDAIQMASTTPARELSVDDRKGTIETGKDADLVLLDESLSVTRTFVKGQETFHR